MVGAPAFADADPSWFLFHASCMARSGGLIEWLDARADPVIMVTDPPYSGTEKTICKRDDDLRRTLKGRAISYGALTPALRRTIAAATAICEWSAIWDRPEGMGAWKTAIAKAGGVWLGVGIVTQARGAPRLRGDGPSVRTLAIALARKRGKAKWNGRTWAEWIEHRSSSPRPIVGTRSIETVAQVIEDLSDSVAGGVQPWVVDPCAGTGTTLLAARRVGLRSAGWERDSITYDYALGALNGDGPPIPGQRQIREALEG